MAAHMTGAWFHIALASSAGVKPRSTRALRSMPILPPLPFTLWHSTQRWFSNSEAPRSESPGITGGTAAPAHPTIKTQMHNSRIVSFQVLHFILLEPVDQMVAGPHGQRHEGQRGV